MSYRKENISETDCSGVRNLSLVHCHLLNLLLMSAPIFLPRVQEGQMSVWETGADERGRAGVSDLMLGGWWERAERG